jgi:hypothetical protein
MYREKWLEQEPEQHKNRPAQQHSVLSYDFKKQIRTMLSCFFVVVTVAFFIYQLLQT